MFTAGRLKISLLAVVFMCALLYADFSSFTAELILAAVIHELGHLFALKLAGAKILEIYILPCGMEIRSDRSVLSYKGEALAALAGPFANLVTGAFSLTVHLVLHDIYTLFFTVCSFFLAVINLLPVKTFDGARALGAFLLLNMSAETAYGIMEWVYYTAFLLLVLISAIVLRLTDGNMSLFLFLCSVFISVYAN